MLKENHLSMCGPSQDSSFNLAVASTLVPLVPRGIKLKSSLKKVPLKSHGESTCMEGNPLQLATLACSSSAQVIGHGYVLGVHQL